MQKWEYLVVYLRDVDIASDDAEIDLFADADAFTERLNTYGKAGWELVSFQWIDNGAKAALKRPIKNDPI